MKVTNDDLVVSARSGSFGVTVDGQGSVVTTGSAGYILIPYAGTITAWYIQADQSGSIQFDVKRLGTSIVGGGNKPHLTSAASGNAAVSGWTSVAIAANDIIEFNVDSVTTITKAQLFITITKD